MKKIKYMVISDIHGDIYNLSKIVKIFYEEKCSKILILGDLFDYNETVNRDEIINRLNLLKNNIICVRGNCDVDIRNLQFEIPEEKIVKINGEKILLIHGDKTNEEYYKNSVAKIIYLGHTHMPNVKKLNNKIIANPGSISKSRYKENTFILVDENELSIRNLDNSIIYKMYI